MSSQPHVKQFVDETFGKSAGKVVAETESLLDSGLIDSTGIYELVTFVENEFDVRVDDEEIVPENFETIESIARFVDRKLGG